MPRTLFCIKNNRLGCFLLFFRTNCILQVKVTKIQLFPIDCKRPNALIIRILNLAIQLTFLKLTDRFLVHNVRLRKSLAKKNKLKLILLIKKVLSFHIILFKSKVFFIYAIRYALNSINRYFFNINSLIIFFWFFYNLKPINYNRYNF